MYLDYFGLSEPPFSIAPDPRYLYMTPRHQEALACLLYGVNGDGGFVLLTGEVGAGKTTVCRCLLEQIPESCDVAFIFNPKLTVEELLSTICTEFGIVHPPGNTSIKVFVDSINTYLLDAHARGRHTVLIIDEAQNLSAEVLEQMRLLTNLETNQRKLLQIILVGQPELLEILERQELRQLAQRIVARYHLSPLTQQEVSGYVAHRLQVSGAHSSLFRPALIRYLYRLSGGVPRLINLLCDRALLGAYAEGQDRVDRATLTKAAREVLGKPSAAVYHRRIVRSLVAGAALLGVGALAIAVYQQEPRSSKAPEIAQKTAVAASSSPAATPGAKLAVARPAHSTDAAVPQTGTVGATAAKPQVVPAASPLSDEALAYMALFKLWGANYQPTAHAGACVQAEQFGLRCLSGQAKLDDLRQMNLPAMLRLRGAQGEEIHAVLSSVGNQAVILLEGGETKAVALSVLTVQWSGEYTLLWRAPPGYKDKLMVGSQGPAVAWLGKQLALLQGGKTEPPASLVFDAALARRVSQFQRAERLNPDGRAGPKTLIALGNRLAGTRPQLVQ